MKQIILKVVQVVRPKCPLNISLCLFVVILLSFNSLGIRELQPVLEEVSVAVRKASVFSVSV